MLGLQKSFTMYSLINGILSLNWRDKDLRRRVFPTIGET